MKFENEYLFKQVFSVVIIVLLLVTFYIMVAGSSVTGMGNVITPLLLIIIAIVCLAIMSEVAKLNTILSKRK
jgi:hypothetical protein